MFLLPHQWEKKKQIQPEERNFTNKEEAVKWHSFFFLRFILGTVLEDLGERLVVEAALLVKRCVAHNLIDLSWEGKEKKKKKKFSSSEAKYNGGIASPLALSCDHPQSSMPRGAWIGNEKKSLKNDLRIRIDNFKTYFSSSMPPVFSGSRNKNELRITSSPSVPEIWWN